jgi:pSer/pThr/pTyr-binding forkhead associated (FHA) protein
VRDLGGKIGTFVNGERVEGEQQLQPGDTLKVGPLRFEVVMSTPTQAEQRPKKRDKEPAAANTAEPNKPSAGDIDSWLSDDTSPTPTPERKPASPRRRVDPSVSSDEASSSTESTDSDGPQAGEENEDSDPKFGKLPTPPPKSANSRDAADEMLRRMRRGS